ncbi:host-nuclease inhibitor Gam family protein [Escherichia coli]
MQRKLTQPRFTLPQIKRPAITSRPVISSVMYMVETIAHHQVDIDSEV